MPQTPQSLTTTRKDIRATIEAMAGQFAMALPKLLTPERFVRVALTCINKNPKLLACTRESLLACLLDCAQLGIEPDGRRAHLIPYGDKCTLIIDYKGLAELVRRSGEVSTLHAGIVYPSDEFDYSFGTGQFLKHRPSLSREEGEKPICVYSYIRLKDGSEDFDVMGIAEVEKVRQRSRAANAGPWVTDFPEMAKKTAFRRHSKWLPLSPELREKIEKDDEPLTEQERFAAARPIATSKIEFGPADVEPADMGSVTGESETTDRLAEQERERDHVATGEPPSLSKPTQTTEGLAQEQAPTQDQPQPAKKAKKEAPPKATPLEGLRNLIKASPVEEEQLVRYLVQTMMLEPSQKLEALSEENLKRVIDDFMSIAASILEPKP
jgi:recombination protein RecT